MSRTVSFCPSRTLTSAQLITPTQTLSHAALIDSGADESFIDWRLAKRLGLNVVPLLRPLVAKALDGRLLCRVTHRTRPLQLIIANGHTESLSFHLFNSPSHPLILGYPWLVKHNPHMDWSTGRVLGWHKDCLATCFPSAPAPERPLPSTHVTVALTTAVSTPLQAAADSDFPDLSRVPTCYRDLKKVFNKTRASTLPPHRPYDCSIDLFPGTSPSKGHLYSLSGPERETMKRYIDSSLAAGIIRPSSSPAGAGFFFVDKKDKTLRPCVDYRGLNDITIKNRYPLPLISSAFELLQDAKIFTKLDL